MQSTKATNGNGNGNRGEGEAVVTKTDHDETPETAAAAGRRITCPSCGVRIAVDQDGKPAAVEQPPAEVPETAKVSPSTRPATDLDATIGEILDTLTRRADAISGSHDEARRIVRTIFGQLHRITTAEEFLALFERGIHRIICETNHDLCAIYDDHSFAVADGEPARTWTDWIDLAEQHAWAALISTHDQGQALFHALWPASLDVLEPLERISHPRTDLQIAVDSAFSSPCGELVIVPVANEPRRFGYCLREHWPAYRRQLDRHDGTIPAGRPLGRPDEIFAAPSAAA